MHIKLLALTWAFLVSVVLCDGGIQSLFNVKTDSNTKGGCKSRFPTALNKLVSESKTLVASALKVFDDAQDSSAAEHDVAVRYLRTYFYVTTEASDTVNFNFVKSQLPA